MKVWQIKFDNAPGTGFLVFEDGQEPFVTHKDGTPAPEVTEYTTLDVDPQPAPSWSVA